MIELSISKRIIIWSVLLVISIIFCFGIGSLIYVKTRLTDELIDRLTSEAVDVSRSLSFLDGRLIIKEDIEWEEMHHKTNDKDPIYIIILNNDHQEVRRSENCLELEIALEELKFSRTDAQPSELFVNRQKWQFVTSPLRYFDALYGWIIVGMSFETIDHIISVLMQIYLVGLPLIITMTVVGSSALAHRVLDPIQKMSQKAREIQTVNLSSRLPQSNTRDEIAHLSQTLNNMLERIQNGMEAVRQFTANASHELKTPITIINSRIEQLEKQDHNLDPEAVADIRREIKRLSQIIDDLAILSKVDSDTVQIQKESIWINDLIYDEIIRFNKNLHQNNCDIITANLESVEITGDEYWLRIMFSNLIDNALKYSPPDSMIELKMVRENNKIKIIIDDNGSGVPPKDLANLTKRFFRAKSTGSIAGSGLGLSIVKWVTDAHNWELSFFNREAGGLRVVVALDT